MPCCPTGSIMEPTRTHRLAATRGLRWSSDEQDREAVVELVLLDLEPRSGRLGRGERRQDGDRSGEDEVSHRPSSS